MNILFSGYHNPNFLTITEYMENALRALGHELFIFDQRKYIIPGRIRSRIKWLNQWDRKRINRKIMSLAKKNMPDLAIITGGHGITADTVKTLKDIGMVTALWTTDAPRNFDPILNVAPNYDFIFCQGSEAVELFEKAGINNAKWLPVGCDPQFHHPVQTTDEEKIIYTKDVSFVGSYYPNRWEILKKLTEFDFGIWGPHWDKVKTDSLRNYNLNNVKLPHAEWLKIYSCAKIVLIIHYQDGRIPCYQASPKVFEALACGCFILVDRQKDVLNLFKNKKHLVVFENLEDLKRKIRFYLDNPLKRKKIAEKGQKEAIKYHNYSCRIETLLSRVKSN